jgi:hypothetical protein
MLVWRLSPDVLLHTSTPCPIRVAGIENMQNDIARVDDLVQLVPNTLAGTLHEDELSCLRKVAIGVVIVGLGITRVARKQMSLLQTIEISVVHGTSATSKIFNGAEFKLWPFALCLGTECVTKRLRLDGNLGGVLLEAVDVALLLNQAHGQLVALHEKRRWVGGLRLDSRAERLERILRDDTRVVEPLPVGLDAGDRRLTGLVRGSFGDVSLGVALGLAVSEALENLYFLRITARQLVFWQSQFAQNAIPVKVLSLDLDIAHAIARLPLALLPVCFFLLCTHGGGFSTRFEVW